MKDYFVRLFRYDHFTNEVLLNEIKRSDHPLQAVNLMAHLLAAQQVWLNRCKQEFNAPAPPLWPTDWTIDYQLKVNDENNKAWLDFLNDHDDAFWGSTFTYQNSSGKSFTNVYMDVIAHVINHGTHHRAQVGQVLKNNGIGKLPVTDYIAYLRH